MNLNLHCLLGHRPYFILKKTSPAAAYADELYRVCLRCNKEKFLYLVEPETNK